MKKLYFLFFTILISSLSFGQIVINEVDADTPGTDVAEFIELLWTPNTSLDGYVVVLFNGSNDLSYISFDLDGYSTDANGFFILANTPLVVAGDLDVGSSNIIQNGADAVAVYLDDASNWPNDTAISTTNLIDVFIYDTNDSDDMGLLTGFGVSTQYNEAENGFKDTQSLQRQSDGTYLAFDPTLRAENTAPSPNPTLTLLDAPPSGGTITVGPEDLSGDLEFVVTNFVVDAPSNGDGYISWQISNVTDGGIHDSGDIFDTSTPTAVTPLLPNKEYFLSAELLDNSDTPLQNLESGYNLQAFTLGYNSVADLSGVRAGAEGLYYEVTGEVIITYIVTENSRNQKYVQDNSMDPSGILIDDPDGIQTTMFNMQDGITGLKGQLSSFNGVLQLVPTVNIAVASSTGNLTNIEDVTAADLFSNGENYESELIRIDNITFTDAGGTFSDNTNYDIVDGGTTTICRVAFGDENLIGASIPAGSSSIIGLGSEFNGTYQILPRFLSDVENATLSSEAFSPEQFKVYPNPTSFGYVAITSSNNTKINVSVYDILGKQIMNESLENNRLDVSGLTSGMYILKVTQDNTISTKKLVIQ